MRFRLLGLDGQKREVAVAASIVRLGRDSTCEVAFDAAVHPMVSGEHARIERTAIGLTLTHRSRSNHTLLNDRPVEGSAPLKAKDRIRLGYKGPTVEVLAVEAAPDAPPAQPTEQAEAVEEFGTTVEAEPQHLRLLRGTLGADRFAVGRGGVIGRDKDQAGFHLDHPHVSRCHARVRVEEGDVILSDLGSANGTYVNGRRITKPVILNEEDRIDIGPFSLRFDGEALVGRSRSNNIELAARKLRRVVKDRATGAPLTLLHDVNLVIRPAEFACLLGPSGSGKSTLLAMLSGRNPPDRGSVVVNGEDLYANFAALKEDIAVVPQRDVLHDSLAVARALGYTAELRLPPDMRADEVESTVSDILDVVGLTKRRGTLIRHLSGGQVKRASLANELIARPSLLFLDEVTSGLDEQTDREMMKLFRQVADSGKTVVCITHSLANVEDSCHLVVILTEGGRLAFVGTPEEARGYFGIARLGHVYDKLGERKPEEWQTRFRASPLYGRYVRERMLVEPDGEDEEQERVEPVGRAPVNPLRQAWVLTRRYAAIWGGDPAALLTILGQSLLVAVLLGAVFGRLGDLKSPVEHAQRTVNLLFLMNVACFWFGCNNAAKEIVKERLIYTRERDFNLRIDSYFASKLLVLVLIAQLQAGLLFGIVRLWCGPPGTAFWQWAVLAALASAGTTLGLLISACARTEEVAVALVPIAVLPQIILGGVIAPLSGVIKLLAQGLVSVYWAERALESLLPDRDLSLLQLGRAEYGKQVAVVAAHLLGFAGMTVLILKRRGGTKGSG